MLWRTAFSSLALIILLGPGAGAQVSASPSSGILYDRVAPIARVGELDGTPAAPASSAGRWRQAAHELRSAADTPPWRDVISIRRDARLSGETGVIPIGILNARYDRRAGPQNERLVSARAFAVAALWDHTYRGSRVTFALDPRFYLSNDPAAVGAISVDFGDGRGWQEARLGARAVVSYARAGEKTLRVRMTLADGTRLEGAATFEVRSLAAPLPDDTLHVTASIPYLSQAGSGEAYVYLASGHTAITQPVIVVEGFDIEDAMNWDELYALLNDEGLVETLRADGYDAVVLNFASATDYIQRNAFVLVELIEQVQAMLLPQQQFPLVGASMGGLVARYALAYMETNAIAHRASLYMSFDTPHAGANIPLGIQYWLDFFADQSADAAFLLSRLDTPSARQMLVYHHTTPPSVSPEADPLRADFIADLAGLGNYPSVRKVAVANGSGAMLNQGFAPGAQLIQWEYDTLLIDIIGNVWAVPDGASTQIFEGYLFVIFLENRSLDLSVGGTLPYDNAPGGSRASMADMDAVVAPYGDIVALHQNHCFIPTVSALDLATSDLFYDIAGDPNLLAITPFDAVFYSTVNEPHVDVTPENAVWIIDEIEGAPTAVASGVMPAARLAQNHPNPFNPQTAIRYSLPAAAPVRLEVFDARGRHVATLHEGRAGAGDHVARWDGRDRAGGRVSSGVYFYRLVTPWGAQTRKMVLLR